MNAKQWGRGALLVVLMGLVAWLAWHGARAAIQARRALADLDRLQAAAADPSLAALPALQNDLRALETHLRGTEAAAKPFLWLAPRLGWLPEIGPTVAAAPALLQTGIQLAGAGRQTLDVLAPLADVLQNGATQALPEVVRRLQEAGPQLSEARGRVLQAEALRATIAAPLHPRLAPQIARLDQLLPLARAGLDVALAAPGLLGAERPRTYLILAQNNHELRATGGFISGVGVVRLDAGRITELQLGDSYSVDDLSQPHPTPPRPLAVYMGAEIWLVRDSNWSPDFTESAQVARALMAQDQGVTTDGAIALDLEAVRLLVSALGALQIEGIAEPVTAENVIDWMKRAWEAPTAAAGTVQEAPTSDWWLKRKDFMGELVKAALARLNEGGTIKPAALARAGLTMLGQRHLQVAVDDPVLARLLAERGWDGGLRPPAGSDFLAVIDSNVGFNKANAAVTPAIAYAVAPADGGLMATLTITYTHNGPADAEPVCDRAARYGDSYDALINRCYWNYLRVYAPSGSELLFVDGLNHSSSEPGERRTTVFAGDFVLSPGGQHTVVLRYRLPADLPIGPYRLFVRKQAGAGAIPLQVMLGGCPWSITLEQDRTFECAALR